MNCFCYLHFEAQSYNILRYAGLHSCCNLLASLMSGNFHQPNKDQRSELFLLTELDVKSCKAMPVCSLAGRTHGQRLIKTRFLQNGADFPKCSYAVPLCSFSPPYPLWIGFIGSKLFQNFPQYILERLGHLGKQP